MKALFWIALFAGIYFVMRSLEINAQIKSRKKEPEPKPATVDADSVGIEKKQTQSLRFFRIKDNGYHVSVCPNVEGYQGLDYVEFQIAGISHRANVAKKHLGESLAILSPEPDNPYDPNAIRVMTSDWQLLGYVPRDMTAEIRRHTNITCPCFIYIGYRPDDDMFYTDAYINLNLIKK